MSSFVLVKALLKAEEDQIMSMNPAAPCDRDLVFVDESQAQLLNLLLSRVDLQKRL